MSNHRTPLCKLRGKARLRVEELEPRTLLSSATTSHLPVSGSIGNFTPPPIQSVIVSQPWDHQSSAGVAQVFTDRSNFKITSYEFDDFTTTQTYDVTIMVAPGQELGASAANKAVIGEIWTGLPDKGGVRVMAGIGLEVNSALVIDFGGHELAPGSYWITAYVVRPFSNGGGQWFWDETTPVTGSEEYFYNPLGGFHFGTSSIPGSVVFGAPHNQAFTLYGRGVADLLTASSSGKTSETIVSAGTAAHSSGALDLAVLDSAFAGSDTGAHSAGTGDPALVHPQAANQTDLLSTLLQTVWND